MNIKDMVKNRRQEIIDNITTLVSYPSVENLNEAPTPFGFENARVLEAALKMCESYGFTTKNLDNYAGYAEMGTGEKLIGVIGHLDVVPVSDGWSTDPFTATLKDGKLYGRGTSDDKGPVVCAMVAMSIVKELRPDMNKRVRLIMGCNEESGSRCLAHYVEKEGHIDYGFTPDGPFPGCHGEKGMVGATFHCPLVKIHSINGGTVSNVVCAKVVLEVETGSYDADKLHAFFSEHNITCNETVNGETTVLTVIGSAAHASTPEVGVNAISYAIEGLFVAGMQDPFVEFYHDIIGLGYNGEKMNIDFEDDYGKLTLNVGVIHTENRTVTGTIDIRFPVTMHSEQITEGMMNATKARNLGSITIHRTGEPLFFPIDSDLVSVLLQSYQEVTGDTDSKPVTMGGGTYAKGIHNCIAFGGSFEDTGNTHMHDNDEFITLNDIDRQTEIYVHAILKLLDL